MVIWLSIFARTNNVDGHIFAKFIMRTRSAGPVTCSLFGVHRKAMYPGYFFCNACDLWDDAVMNGNRRANRKQDKY